jgi:hypothetical protein
MELEKLTAGEERLSREIDALRASRDALRPAYVKALSEAVKPYYEDAAGVCEERLREFLAAAEVLKSIENAMRDAGGVPPDLRMPDLELLHSRLQALSGAR